MQEGKPMVWESRQFADKLADMQGKGMLKLYDENSIIEKI